MSRLHAGSALAALFLLATAPAYPSDTVQVGKETKTTVGVVTELQAGDVACYLTLKDDRGGEHQELADFSLCEKSALTGKRVRLTYALGKVMADECQGNPDCTKSKTVALVTAAQVLAPQPAAPQTAPAPPAQPAKPSQASLCTPLETVVFGCRIGAKRVSVCASKGASSTQGTLQYRFGKSSSKEGLELTLPEADTPPAKSANGGSLAFSGGGAAWLRFHKGTYAYVVFTGIGRWGPHGEPRDKEGVVVERGGKVVTSLKCSDLATSLLGDEWFAAVGVKENGEEFELPD